MSLYLWDKEMSVYVWDVLVSWWSWYDWPYSYSTMQWPCDTWFHVMSSDEFNNIKNIWTTLWWWSSAWGNFCNALKIPFWWYRYQASINNVWSRAFLWSATSYGDSSAYAVQFQDRALDFSGYGKNFWCQIRPIRNTPIIPDSSWTKMYWTSIAAWWIFWSASEWLISLSKNGTDWITVADKNLGATVVWNQWDSVTDANCGYFYQWGNNYWFPHSWSLPATTTSQVNASAYWPSNPYSSNVYYTGWLNSWDNSWNTNLWWWVNPSTYDYVEIDGDRYIKQ